MTKFKLNYFPKPMPSPYKETKSMTDEKPKARRKAMVTMSDNVAECVTELWEELRTLVDSEAILEDDRTVKDLFFKHGEVIIKAQNRTRGEETDG